MRKFIINLILFSCIMLSGCSDEVLGYYKRHMNSEVVKQCFSGSVIYLDKRSNKFWVEDHGFATDFAPGITLDAFCNGQEQKN